MADRPTKITFAEMRDSGVVHLELGPGCEIYLALTTLAHHHVMKTRDNMSAVIEGLQRQHGLLAAYLEAIAETPKPVNVEAHRVSAGPRLPEVVPSTSPFVFRRANLVRVNPERRSLAAAAPPSPSA